MYSRFANWEKKDVWSKVFYQLRIEVDDVASIVDGSTVRAHQDASGGKGDPTKCFGTLSWRFFDHYARGRALIGDTGLDSNEYRAEIENEE